MTISTGPAERGGGTASAAAARTGLSASEQRMVTENIGLVHHIASRVVHRFPSDYDRDDLVQVGTLGLIDAVRRFDPDRGVRFSGYAGRRIEGAITDYLRSTDWAPRSVRSRRRILAMAEARGATTDDEVSRLSGLDPDTVRRVRADVERANLLSFERVVDAGADVNDGNHSIDTELLREESAQTLRSALDRLPSRQRMLVEAHFLDGRTLTEIGEAMGVTQSRASQLKAEALATLRRQLSETLG
ncbi:MAG: sigma-70 family RNA polymerase sigma factor [Acidimicrobiia bacterium]|nr:sigma-70 family RNA polymerase sigma factor [Acidimicrobiia bacterium]